MVLTDTSISIINGERGWFINPSYAQRRRDSINDHIEHQKLKSVLYRTFTRTEPDNGYFFTGQDIDPNPGQKRGSWDVVFVSNNSEDSSPPIFVEVKSRFNSASELIAELESKISQTMSILTESPRDLYSQILEHFDNELPPQFLHPEFVIFTQGTFADSLLSYIGSGGEVNHKINLIVWSYGFVNSHMNVISIPYADRTGIKTCKNTNEQTCNICLCNHEDKTLMSFLRDLNNQLLEGPRIIPSARKYVDPAVNILSVLSYGEVFTKEDKHFTIQDLRDKIGSFLLKFSIRSLEAEVTDLINDMIITRIILPSKGFPIEAYHLNSAIKNIISNEEALITDVAKRAIKYLKGTTTLDQF